MSAPATPPHYALFATPLGQCGIAWRDGVIIASQLPEENDEITAARLSRRAGGARPGMPPPHVATVIAAIQRLLSGERDQDGKLPDLCDIKLDMGGLEPLAARILEETRKVLPGQTRRYGEIAVDLGNRQLAQAVGQALGHNPFPVLVPCHRVVGANGRLTGFSAGGGIGTKMRMLEIEGARLAEPPTLFDTLPLSVKPPRRS
nr:methylated-DNA--[protein]-cysteine S-methyltransferase [uncultured Gellertiella sp.]